MFTKNIAVLLAVSGAYASPLLRRDECSDKCAATYNTCRTAPGSNKASCAADYSSCLGYLPFDDQGSLVTPTACSSTSAPTPTADACVQKCQTDYNTCRTAPGANMSYCASLYAKCLGFSPFSNDGSQVTPTACSTTAGPTITAAPAVSRIQAVEAENWTVKGLTRHCSEDRTGCSYKFSISTNNGQADAACDFSRSGVANAPEESFYNVPCAADSPYMISWGYSTQFETPFAVLTAVDSKKNAQAYFGVNNPTGQPATPENPYGSGNFGDIGPQPVQFN